MAYWFQATVETYKPEVIMKRYPNLAKITLALCLPLLLLASCTGISKAPQHLSPALETASLTTLGILPVTYNEQYAEPLDVRVSPLIMRNTERLLQAKGYRTIVISDPLPPDWMSRDVMAMEPSDIAANLPAGVDGVMFIRVQSHFGIDITERQPDIMGPAISINAVAKLVSAQNPEELWQDKGTGRSYTDSRFLRRTQFLVRLDQAARSLVDSLLFTLPARTN